MWERTFHGLDHSGSQPSNCIESGIELGEPEIEVMESLRMRLYTESLGMRLYSYYNN